MLVQDDCIGANALTRNVNREAHPFLFRLVRVSRPSSLLFLYLYCCGLLCEISTFGQSVSLSFTCQPPHRRKHTSKQHEVLGHPPRAAVSAPRVHERNFCQVETPHPRRHPSIWHRLDVFFFLN